MLGFSTIALVKLILLGLLSFTLLLSVSSIYIGPRYGKRLPYDSSTRVVLRSSSPRTIQSRSQVRFYAGSRYGGKRSYWDTSMPESETPLYTDFVLKSQQQQQQQQQAGNNSPYECLYIPYVGLVRCLPRHSENTWNSIGESDEDSDNPMAGSPSPALSVSGVDAS